MNVLSYKTTEDNGLSFELLVDGELLRELIDSPNGPLPFWLFLSGKDWPAFDSWSEELAPGSRIVTVCSCGEAGCGHSECEILREGEAVVFRNFKSEVSPEAKNKEFRFSVENYDSVFAELIQRSYDYEKRT